MEELIAQLKVFLGKRVRTIGIKGPAEINIIVAENENAAALSAELQQYVAEIVDANSLAKINVISPDGNVTDSFSLNQ